MKLIELSPRERQIVALVSEGLPYKQISSRLGIADRTVEATMQRVYEKTGKRGIVCVLREFYDFIPRKD